MNIPNFKNISLFIFLPLLFSCKKNSGNNENSKIYIAGTNGINPVLWVNGNASLLSSSNGYASQVLLSGNNVYLAGVDSQSNTSNFAGAGGKYVYWNNGVQNSLGSISANPVLPSLSIWVYNVYCSSNYQAWKNGSPISLQGLGVGFISSVFIDGTDIYFTGSDSVGDAVYWKNGQLNVLSRGSYSNNTGIEPAAYCIAVSGNEVYVGGSDSTGRGAYWENGKITQLQAIESSNIVLGVRSILLSITGVYMLANLSVSSNGGTNAPAYWRNGVEYDLPLDAATYGSANGIFVSDDDVYIAGSTSQGAVYWKNEVQNKLSSSVTGSANSIFVQ